MIFPHLRHPGDQGVQEAVHLPVLPLDVPVPLRCVREPESHPRAAQGGERQQHFRPEAPLAVAQQAFFV